MTSDKHKIRSLENFDLNQRNVRSGSRNWSIGRSDVCFTTPFNDRPWHVRKVPEIASSTVPQNAPNAAIDYLMVGTIRVGVDLNHVG